MKEFMKVVAHLLHSPERSKLDRRAMRNTKFPDRLHTRSCELDGMPEIIYKDNRCLFEINMN